MGFDKEYIKKRVSASAAVKKIKSGDWVDYAHWLATPFFLDGALSKRVNELSDVKVRAAGYPGFPAVAMEDPTGRHFNYISGHFTAAERALHDKGHAHYLPILYHEAPRFMKTLHSDVFMFRTTPMDRNGFFNYGVANDVVRTLIDGAGTVVVEVNENLPYCCGGNHESVHVSEVDYIVETDNAPMLCGVETPPTENEKKIAAHIVAHIEDGACIQLGIGGIPNAIGRLIARSDVKDIGVQTEMLSDAYLDMYEAGRITNRKKTLDRGKMTYTFAFGSRRLYEFMDHNPLLASYPVNYTNKPAHIAANDGMVSINSAVEVDLYGQVSSESVGTRQISGTGGQFDFHYGAYHSRGGKAFICLESTKTAKDSTVRSRIRPFFEPGTIVTLPRTAVHYIVTEYGTAMLKGKSTWERAEALINIAHPDFREELVLVAGKMKIWTAANKVTH